MSSALNGSAVLQRFERGNAVELRNRSNVRFLPGTATYAYSSHTHALHTHIHTHSRIRTHTHAHTTHTHTICTTHTHIHTHTHRGCNADSFRQHKEKGRTSWKAIVNTIECMQSQWHWCCHYYIVQCYYVTVTFDVQQIMVLRKSDVILVTRPCPLSVLVQHCAGRVASVASAIKTVVLQSEYSAQWWSCRINLQHNWTVVWWRWSSAW